MRTNSDYFHDQLLKFISRDAWDVEIHHLETPHQLKFESVKVVENGPVLASLVGVVKYGKSTINVTISVSALPATRSEDSRSFFRFDADVDWRQRHEILKFEIPLSQ